MQKFQMYSIYDAKAQIFHPPYFNLTHGEAERTFGQIVNDEKTQISQFPEDFDLYHIGEYNDSTGKMSPNETPKHMLKAIALKRQKPGLTPEQTV